MPQVRGEAGAGAGRRDGTCPEPYNPSLEPSTLNAIPKPTSRRYVVKLVQELDGATAATFTAPSDRDRSKSVLADLQKTAGDFRALAGRALEAVAAGIVPRLRRAFTVQAGDQRLAHARPPSDRGWITLADGQQTLPAGRSTRSLPASSPASGAHPLRCSRPRHKSVRLSKQAAWGACMCASCSDMGWIVLAYDAWHVAGGALEAVAAGIVPSSGSHALSKRAARDSMRASKPACMGCTMPAGDWRTWPAGRWRQRAGGSVPRILPGCWSQACAAWWGRGRLLGTSWPATAPAGATHTPTCIRAGQPACMPSSAVHPRTACPDTRCAGAASGAQRAWARQVLGALGTL